MMSKYGIFSRVDSVEKFINTRENGDEVITLTGVDAAGDTVLQVSYVEGSHALPVFNYVDRAGHVYTGVNAHTSNDSRARVVKGGQQIYLNEIIFQMDRLYNGLGILEGEYNHNLAHQFWSAGYKRCCLECGEVFGLCAGSVTTKAQNLKHKMLVEQIFDDLHIVVSMPATSRLMGLLGDKEVINFEDLFDSGVQYRTHRYTEDGKPDSPQCGDPWVEFLY